MYLSNYIPIHLCMHTTYLCAYVLIPTCLPARYLPIYLLNYFLVYLSIHPSVLFFENRGNFKPNLILSCFNDLSAYLLLTVFQCVSWVSPHVTPKMSFFVCYAAVGFDTGKSWIQSLQFHQTVKTCFSTIEEIVCCQKGKGKQGWKSQLDHLDCTAITCQ